MRMDEGMLFDFMSQYSIIGEVAFGGSGTREEDILVGYIYGVLSSNPSSSMLKAELDYEVFLFGGYRYIVWMDEIDYEDEDEPEETGQNELVRIEQVNPYEEDLTDEDIQDFLDNAEEDMFPVAIEGPLTERELKEKFGGEFFRD